MINFPKKLQKLSSLGSYREIKTRNSDLDVAYIAQTK